MSVCLSQIFVCPKFLSVPNFWKSSGGTDMGGTDMGGLDMGGRTLGGRTWVGTDNYTYTYRVIQLQVSYYYKLVSLVPNFRNLLSE